MPNSRYRTAQFATITYFAMGLASLYGAIRLGVEAFSGPISQTPLNYPNGTTVVPTVVPEPLSATKTAETAGFLALTFAGSAMLMAGILKASQLRKLREEQDTGLPVTLPTEKTSLMVATKEETSRHIQWDAVRGWFCGNPNKQSSQELEEAATSLTLP